MIEELIKKSISEIFTENTPMIILISILFFICKIFICDLITQLFGLFFLFLILVTTIFEAIKQRIKYKDDLELGWWKDILLTLKWFNNLEKRIDGGNTLLLYAAKKNCNKIVRDLIFIKADINKRNDKKENLLHYVLGNYMFDIFQELDIKYIEKNISKKTHIKIVNEEKIIDKLVFNNTERLIQTTSVIKLTPIDYFKKKFVKKKEYVLKNFEKLDEEHKNIIFKYYQGFKNFFDK